MMSKVALVRCETYAEEMVAAAIERGMTLLGGVGAFVRPGEKILLKPNWLMAVPPERCATTHPAVFKGVAQAFQKAGAALSYGDSPGVGSPAHAADKTGCRKEADSLGIPLADFVGGREVFFPEARQNKKLLLANGALDCDGIVSLSKLKTHGFMNLTGAVKNQFGCVPGLHKGEFHCKLPNPADFARMLVDINSYLHPRLYIMDGILAMEGNGPLNGTPKAMNVLLLSADPIALDATVCRMLGMDPTLSLTVTAGREAGLGMFEEDAIQLLGDPLAEFVDMHFKADRQSLLTTAPQRGALRFVNGLIVSKPYILKDKCKKCGICVRACPVKPAAVDWPVKNSSAPPDSPPAYQYSRCIRCYCCQELCPEGAIEVKKPLLRKVLRVR